MPSAALSHAREFVPSGMRVLCVGRIRQGRLWRGDVYDVVADMDGHGLKWILWTAHTELVASRAPAALATGA